MKKAGYILLLAVTFYLRLVYRWDGGTVIFLAELFFFLLLLAEAKAGKAVLSIMPVSGFAIAEEGENVELVFIIENTGNRSVPLLRCEIGGKKYVFRRVRARTKRKIVLRYPAAECGRKRIGAAKLKAWASSGIFRMRIRIKRQEEAEIRVIPKPWTATVEITDAVRRFETEGEEYAKDRGGDDTAEIFDVRPYRPGDKLSRIHWKLTARSDVFYMKEAGHPLGAAVVLLLDGAKKADSVSGNGRIFLKAAASAGRALMEEECRFYAVWKEKETDMWTRRLIKDEETYYEWMLMLAGISPEEIAGITEEEYKREFAEPFWTVIRIGTDAVIQAGEQPEIRLHEKTAEKELEKTVITV